MGFCGDSNESDLVVDGFELRQGVGHADVSVEGKLDAGARLKEVQLVAAGGVVLQAHGAGMRGSGWIQGRSEGPSAA